MVNLTVNGGERAEVKVGKKVKFSALIETPPDTGYVVGAEWDFEGVGDYPWKVSEFEEPRIMAWEVTGGRFEGNHGAYRIEPDGDGSRVTIETRFKRGIIMWFLGLLLKGMLKRGNVTDLEKLKVILET